MAGFQTRLQAKTQATILHYLKANGGALETASVAPSDSLVRKMAEDFREKQTVVKYALRQLEKESLVLISHLRPIASFGEGKGYNPITRIEMVDPEMELPELETTMTEYSRPDEIVQQTFIDEDAMSLTPLGRGQKHSVTYQLENEEMQTRHQTEPTTESIILALLNRNDELQAELFARAETIAELREQVEKLQEVISKQAAEQMNKPKPTRDAHLTQRIRGALTPEQWDALMASRPIN